MPMFASYRHFKSPSISSVVTHPDTYEQAMPKTWVCKKDMSIFLVTVNVSESMMSVETYNLLLSELKIELQHYFAKVIQNLVSPSHRNGYL